MQELIQEIAPRYGLDPRLVQAIVKVESAGNPWAWNPEPRYRYLWDVSRNQPFKLTSDEASSKTPPADFPHLKGDRDQEWWGQQASWGLMQLMGAVAREYGCREPYLTALLGPELNLRYGCLHLQKLRRRFEGEHGLDGVIAAYNAGSPRYDNGTLVNQGYVKKVRTAYV